LEQLLLLQRVKGTKAARKKGLVGERKAQGRKGRLRKKKSPGEIIWMKEKDESAKMKKGRGEE